MAIYLLGMRRYPSASETLYRIEISTDGATATLLSNQTSVAVPAPARSPAVSQPPTNIRLYAEGTEVFLLPGQATPQFAMDPGLQGYLTVPISKATLTDGTLGTLAKCTGETAGPGTVAHAPFATWTDGSDRYFLFGGGPVLLDSGARQGLTNRDFQLYKLTGTVMDHVKTYPNAWAGTAPGPRHMIGYNNKVLCFGAGSTTFTAWNDACAAYPVVGNDLKAQAATYTSLVYNDTHFTETPFFISEGGAYVAVISGVNNVHPLGTSYSVRYHITDPPYGLDPVVGTLALDFNGIAIGDAPDRIEHLCRVGSTLWAVVRNSTPAKYRLYKGTIPTNGFANLVLQATAITVNIPGGDYNTGRLTWTDTTTPPAKTASAVPPSVAVDGYDVTPPNHHFLVTGTVTHPSSPIVEVKAYQRTGDSLAWVDKDVSSSLSLTPDLTTNPLSVAWTYDHDASDDPDIGGKAAMGYLVIEGRTSDGRFVSSPRSTTEGILWRVEIQAPTLTGSGLAATNARLGYQVKVPITATERTVSGGKQNSLVRIQYYITAQTVSHASIPEGSWVDLWATETAYASPSTSRFPGVSDWSGVLTYPETPYGHATGTKTLRLSVRALDANANVTKIGPYDIDLDTDVTETLDITFTAPNPAYWNGTVAGGNGTVEGTVTGTETVAKHATWRVTAPSTLWGTTPAQSMPVMAGATNAWEITEAEIIDAFNRSGASLPDGAYTLEMTVLNALGTTHTESFTWTVDRTGPTVTFLGLGENPYHQYTVSTRRPTFKIYVNGLVSGLVDASPILLERQEGESWTDRTVWLTGGPTYTFTAPVDLEIGTAYGAAEHFRLTATDKAGNASVTTFSLNVHIPGLGVLDDLTGYETHLRGARDEEI